MGCTSTKTTCCIMLFILQGWKYSKWAYSCIFAMYTLYSINCHNVSKAIKSTIPKFAIFLGGIPTINLYGWMTLLYGRYRVSSRCFQQITIRVIALLSLDFPHKPFLGFISHYIPLCLILSFCDLISPFFLIWYPQSLLDQYYTSSYTTMLKSKSLLYIIS